MWTKETEDWDLFDLARSQWWAAFTPNKVAQRTHAQSLDFGVYLPGRVAMKWSVARLARLGQTINLSWNDSHQVWSGGGAAIDLLAEDSLDEGDLDHWFVLLVLFTRYIGPVLPQHVQMSRNPRVWLWPEAGQRKWTLTYCQPTFCWQTLQKMSLTECFPVARIFSTDSPCSTLILYTKTENVNKKTKPMKLMIIQASFRMRRATAPCSKVIERTKGKTSQLRR